MPKITEKDFGKKFTKEGFEGFNYFIPLAFTSKRELLGEDEAGCIRFPVNCDNWFPYEEPKKKVIKRMAPALCYNGLEYYITQDLYESEEAAKKNCPNHFIKFPASESLWVEIEVEE